MAIHHTTMALATIRVPLQEREKYGKKVVGERSNKKVAGLEIIVYLIFLVGVPYANPNPTRLLKNGNVFREIFV